MTNMGTANSKLKVLFIGKADNYYTSAAAEFIKKHFENATIVFSERSQPFPQKLKEWKGDLLISYLAQWIIPEEVILNASLAAVNLHPGPPEYPGIGCTNFAMYNDEKVFGVTMHHMLARVDSGPIISVKRFPVLSTDDVYSLTQRCYVEILHLFVEQMTDLLKGKPFPASQEIWKRKPYKRKELDELCQLTEEMTEEEKQKRIRATTFGEKVWAYYAKEKMQA